MKHSQTRIIITSGPGSEPLDAVRRITNHSTGELGRVLAAEFAVRGCEVICLQGRGATTPCRPEHARVLPFTTNSELLDLLARLAAEPPAPQALFHAAALCDYRTARIEAHDGRSLSGAKLDSRGGELRLVLSPTPKVIARLRVLFPHSLLIGWKYEAEGSAAELAGRVARQLNENATDLCVLNGPAYGPGFGIFAPGRPTAHVESKASLASELARRLGLPDRQEESGVDFDGVRLAVEAILDQGAGLLGALDAATYSRKVPEAYDASIGGHYRHCLDHLEILLDQEGECVDFDARRRDPAVETDPACAREATERLRQRLRRLEIPDWPGKLRLRCQIAYQGGAACVDSTFAREAMYVVAHAIHHYALIGVMCRLQGIPVPAGFGVAPSTLQYQRRLAPPATALR